MPNYKLKELRLSKGIKQIDMANKLKLEPTTYCQKENGSRRFTVEEAIMISDILERDIKEIFLKR